MGGAPPLGNTHSMAYSWKLFDEVTTRASMFKYAWQETIVDAAKEFEPLDRVTKLAKAEDAVRARMAELAAGGDIHEHQALVDALGTLRFLRKDFSDS